MEEELIRETMETSPHVEEHERASNEEAPGAESLEGTDQEQKGETAEIPPDSSLPWRDEREKELYMAGAKQGAEHYHQLLSERGMITQRQQAAQAPPQQQQASQPDVLDQVSDYVVHNYTEKLRDLGESALQNPEVGLKALVKELLQTGFPMQQQIAREEARQIAQAEAAKAAFFSSPENQYLEPVRDTLTELVEAGVPLDKILAIVDPLARPNQAQQPPAKQRARNSKGMFVERPTGVATPTHTKDEEDTMIDNALDDFFGPVVTH